MYQDMFLLERQSHITNTEGETSSFFTTPMPITAEEQLELNLGARKFIQDSG